MIAECLVVEVRVTGDDCPLAEAARATGVRIDARPPQLRSDGTALLRFSADAPDRTRVDPGERGTGSGARGGSDPGGKGGSDPGVYGRLALTLDADERIRYLHAARSDDRINFRCLSKHPCVVHALSDAGLLVESLEYDPRGETYTGAVVGYDVLDAVLSAGADRTGEAEITVERIYPLSADADNPVARRWSITPPQEAALETALEMGFFTVPREADAGDVARELGIGKSAFLERLRRGQRALFEQLFADGR